MWKSAALLKGRNGQQIWMSRTLRLLFSLCINSCGVSLQPVAIKRRVRTARLNTVLGKQPNKRPNWEGSWCSICFCSFPSVLLWLLAFTWVFSLHHWRVCANNNEIPHLGSTPQLSQWIEDISVNSRFLSRLLTCKLMKSLSDLWKITIRKISL